jgi:hypothetical protein
MSRFFIPPPNRCIQALRSAKSIPIRTCIAKIAGLPSCSFYFACSTNLPEDWENCRNPNSMKSSPAPCVCLTLRTQPRRGVWLPLFWRRSNRQIRSRTVHDYPESGSAYWKSQVRTRHVRELREWRSARLSVRLLLSERSGGRRRPTQSDAGCSCFLLGSRAPPPPPSPLLSFRTGPRARWGTRC